MLSLMSVPPEIVGPARKKLLRHARALFDPRGLDVAEGGAQHETRDRVHLDDLVAASAPSRTPGTQLLFVHRRFLMDERERHELGEAAGAASGCRGGAPCAASNAP